MAAAAGIGASFFLLLLSSVFGLYLFYGLANINPNIDQQDTLVWVYAKRSYIRGVAIAGEYLGFGHRVNNSRYLSTTSLLSLGLQTDQDGVKITEDILGGVPVRVYEPVDHRSAASPALIWIHGGGWVSKSANSDDYLMTELTRRLQIVIMSIDYRLAPEHVYPAAFDDCHDASLAFLLSADKFGVDPRRVAIAGASAGGNLAAAVTLKFRDTAQPITFRRQILIVPCLQMFDLNTPSYQQNNQDAFLPKYWMTYYWLWYGFGAKAHDRAHDFTSNSHTSQSAKQSDIASYVKHAYIPTKHLDSSYMPNQGNFGNATLWNEVKHVVLDPYFAPLMAKDLSKLPPSYVATAQYDVLRDDGIMFHKRLESAGSKSKLTMYEGGFHAMIDFFKDLRLSERVVSDLVSYLQQSL